MISRLISLETLHRGVTVPSQSVTLYSVISSTKQQLNQYSSLHFLSNYTARSNKVKGSEEVIYTSLSDCISMMTCLLVIRQMVIKLEAILASTPRIWAHEGPIHSISMHDNEFVLKYLSKPLPAKLPRSFLEMLV